jgi:hypothetical protein
MARRDKHLARAQEYTVPTRRRLACGEPHPVQDFLVRYYSLSLGRLETWHPSWEMTLECTAGSDHPFQQKHYQLQDGIISQDLTTLTEKAAARLVRIATLLRLTQSRPPNFACHGLHEWAMVYQGADIRHREIVPLRLPQSEINDLVRSRPLCCTHFDAFRFFSPEAQPLNKLQPDLDSREANEQPGCIHANMDLYKWAYKSMPWIGSDLLWECFLFALRAREIDMRASPYDLSAYDYPAIPVETPEGRQEYEREQRILAEVARPLRQTLIESLDNFTSSRQKALALAEPPLQT